ncbi:MAG: HlyD family efflux transporter periplasmic adaptor subunit [Rubrivivax sp.]
MRPRPGPRTLLPSLLGVALALLAGCGRGEDSAWFSGYAEADLVYVSAAAAGTLQSVAVRRGDAVRQGQALFALDTEAESLGLAGAAARQQQAQRQAADLTKGRRPQEISAIDAQIAQARAALTASDAALQRQQRLVEQGFVSALRLDELKAARDADQARLAELQADRALALQASRSDQVAAAAAAAQGAAADAGLARWREDQRRRQAPQDAQVYDVLYRAGEWVGAGTPVVALLPPQALKVRFFVPQAQLAALRVGQPLALRCDGCPAGLTARLSWLSPQAEYTPPVIYSNASRAKLVFMAEAQPDDAARAVLKPGLPLDVRVQGAP